MKKASKYDPELSGLVGVVVNYYKDPVTKVGYRKPVVLEIDWGQPPSKWNHYYLNGIAIHEH